MWRDRMTGWSGNLFETRLCWHYLHDETGLTSAFQALVKH